MNEELLEQIALLRSKAQKLIEQAALDQQLVAKYRAQLEILNSQLSAQFNLDSWEKADALLTEYEQRIQNRLDEVRRALAEAGIDDL